MNVTSAEVQDRDGSTLFVFDGDWPDTLAEVPADLRFTANDVALVLHPTEDGLEITEGTVAGEPLPEHTVAATIENGAFMLNLTDPILEAPVRFVLEGLIPTDGELVWGGHGAPTNVAHGQGGGETTTGTETTGGGFRAETVEEFLQAFETAFREGDEAFLFERLNPATVELYGEPQCKALIATLKDPTRAYELRKTSKPKPYDYNPDGRSITVPNVYTVTVQVTANGELSKQEIHLAPVTDTLTWFADCGDPTS